MSRKHTFWERPGVVDVLRAAAAPGIYTASELATLLSERFNVDISRNAVMGKCWRDNIPLRARNELKAPRVKRSALLQCDEPEPRGDVADGCRWMHGPAEDRNFCGAPTVRFGISWCHHHCARVWNPATPAQVAKFAKFVTWRAA